jgi:hypothetical protein
MKTWIPACLALVAVTAAGCGPRVQPIRPIMANGEVLPTQAEETIARARHEGAAERMRLEDERITAAATAMATCTGAICDAVARREVAIGMSEAQLLAATGTSPDAWHFRGDGRASVVTPRAELRGPRDVVGEVVMVNMVDGRVRGYTYREPQGLRTVTSLADATMAGRTAAQADALLREGDDFAAAGDLARALDRYDRADILRAGHPETTLRIATTLDKSLRPFEAALRYRLFIHQLELERIHAHGEAAARMAEAITRAQQRIILLERHR